jgi:hypothetical protein
MFSEDVIAPSMFSEDVIAPSMFSEDVIAPSMFSEDVIAPSMFSVFSQSGVIQLRVSSKACRAGEIHR